MNRFIRQASLATSALCLFVHGIASAGNVAPPGGARSPSTSFNAGTHGTNAGSHESAAPLNQVDPSLLSMPEDGPGPTVYDACMRGGDCDATVIDPNNDLGGKTFRVYDRVLGTLEVKADATGRVVSILHVGA